MTGMTRIRGIRGIRGLAVVALALALAPSAACAAKGARNQARVGALTMTEALVAIDRAEITVSEAGIPQYTTDARDRVGLAIGKVARFVAAYTVAVEDWDQDGTTVPQAVLDADKGLRGAVDELEKALPVIAAIRDPLSRALNALKALIPSPPQSVIEGSEPDVVIAQLPPGVMLFMTLMNLLSKMLGDGRLTIDRIKALLKKEGATDEELDAAKATSLEIAERREAEHGTGG